MKMPCLKHKNVMCDRQRHLLKVTHSALRFLQHLCVLRNLKLVLGLSLLCGALA